MKTDIFFVAAAFGIAIGSVYGSEVVASPQYVEQLQDHLNPLNKKTWLQTYYVNSSHWKGPDSDAPVFLCVGGEGPAMDSSVVSASDHCNNAVEWLAETGALMFALEHRYYTCHNMSACPVESLETANDFQYLSAEQALEDVAHFHNAMSLKYKLAEGTKWVTFGGSYPGMLAAWSRLKYPHLFHIAVASSAPVQAQLEMRGYYDVVARAYATPSVGGSTHCRDRIAEGHEIIGKMMEIAEERVQLENIFRLPTGSLETNEQRRAFAGNGVAEFPAQSNDPSCPEPACNIEKICTIMVEKDFEGPVVALARVKALQTQTAPMNPSISMQRRVLQGDFDIWNWQVCTEFGYLQTCAIGSECMFTQGLVTLESMFDDSCSRFSITDIAELQRSIERTNTRYGGNKTDIERILWVNGSVDPWIALSVQTLTKFQKDHGQKVLLVEGASHHAWTHPYSSRDQESVKKVRKEIRSIVAEWLH